MCPVSIYKSAVIEELQLFYGELLRMHNQLDVFSHLTLMANKMWEGIRNEVPCIYYEFSNYHPEMLGWNFEKIYQRGIDKEDCQLTLARECGYDHWKNISGRYNKIFEHGLDLLLNGNLERFRLLISDNPHLVHETSPYGHKATLLHYTASNGVEMWRQQVPLNLVTIVEILLQNGADPKKKMKVYGRQYDVISLLRSSAHPYNAGIGKELEMTIARSW